MKTVRSFYMMAMVLIFVAPLSVAVAWDRYSNDGPENVLGGSVPFRPIIHYTFYVGWPQWVTLETANSPGDTYMYLWSVKAEKQIAKDDDDGVGYHSKIVAYLPPGYYIAFIRSYSSNALSTTDLYYNGTRVLYGARFAGTRVWTSGLDAETRFRTDNIVATSGSSDTFMLLLNGVGDLIGWNDDGPPGSGTASSIQASETSSSLIVGAYNYWYDYGGTCDIKYIQDRNQEFLAVVGYETFDYQAGQVLVNELDNSFNHYNDIGGPYAAKDWMFRGYYRQTWVDGVDLVYVAAHGNVGLFEDYDTNLVDFTDPEGSAGSGHKANGWSGDLEYIAFNSCLTVRIEDENSWDWLKDRGWQSTYEADGSVRKGFFDGVHIAVGYHSNNTVYSKWYYSYPSVYYEAQSFAYNLRSGNTIWEAFKSANRSTTDKFYHWYYQRHVDLGEISSIYIYQNKDETFNDHKTTDYKIGDWGYYFGWRKNHYWY